MDMRRSEQYIPSVRKPSLLAQVLHCVVLTALVVIATCGVLIILNSLGSDIFEFKSSPLGLVVVVVIIIVALSAMAVIAKRSIETERHTHSELMASHAREAAERDKIFTLINSFTDAVFSIDKDGIVSAYNSATLNLLDTNTTISGAPINNLFRFETASGKKVDIFDELVRTASIQQRDDWIIRIDENDLIRLEVTLAPVQSSNDTDEPASSYVLIVRDITRVKSLEEERDEFISVVSHELRTPITIAEGSLSNAKLLAERGFESKTIEGIAEAHKQVLFLARMINDLSTLSRAERGVSDDPEDIDVTTLAQQLYNEYAPVAEEKGLHLDLDIQGKPAALHISRLYLQELLQNFITNAIKYTPEGSVTLRVIAEKTAVRFEVSDTGIGIGRADLAHIFQRFYRAEDYRTRETNGTGLGLYVASKLAKKLNCHIDVTSRLNHGSTFSFAVPVSKKKQVKRKSKSSR